MARSVGGPTRRSTRDEDEAQERPERRRSARRDEDEERPERGRSARSRRDRDDEDEGRGSRRRASRGRDDDDRGSRRSEGAPRPTNVGRGRASVHKHRESHRNSDFAPKFTFEVGEKVLIKFLDEDFFFTYYEHWIREFRGEKRQMSFVCLGDDCPLCGIGDDPKFTALINVANLSDPKDPKVEVWYATPGPQGEITDAMDDEDTAPVNAPGRYFSVSKKKQKNNYIGYRLDEVDERDLDRKWDMDPLTDAEVERFEGQRFSEDDCVRYNTRRDLQDIADELSD